MKQATSAFVLFVLLATVSGCGDGPQLMVHDCLVYWNEVCDNMIKATDEETAKDLVKVQFKLLGKKHEKLHERVEKGMRDIDKATAKALEDALLDYYWEIKATSERLKNCQQRLDKIIAANPSHDNLTIIRKFADKADFDKISLGDWMPKKGEKAGQFSNGLVPARPVKKGASKPVNVPQPEPGENLPGVQNLKQ